jgi:hypothetical protein
LICLFTAIIIGKGTMSRKNIEKNAGGREDRRKRRQEEEKAG